jgi:hypothetical protein
LGATGSESPIPRLSKRMSLLKEFILRSHDAILGFSHQTAIWVVHSGQR